MSTVPPDDSDNGEQPPFSEDEFEQFDQNFSENFIEWYGEGDAPEWFLNSGDILSWIEEKDSTFLEVQGGITPESLGLDEFGEYHIVLHAMDEDTGDEAYFSFNGWSKEDLLDFYDYIEDYYADAAFWSENYSLAKV
jgi:hypothetical protein